MAGLILALDLAIRMGVAFGRPGEKPESLTVLLKQPADPPAVAYANLIDWLASALGGRGPTPRPQLVFKERMLPLEAFRKLGNASATVRLQAGMHAITEGVCGRFAVGWDERPDSTVRLHFIGKARMGDRIATKRAVVHRCHVLGYLPRDSSDDNRADALACWDWACAHHGRTPPAKLFMFGEAAS